MNFRKPYDMFCQEHIYYGSAFNDIYDFYFTQGNKTLYPLEYTNPRDIIDVMRNGISFFAFCNGPVDSFTGSFETANLFIGGQGSSNFIPIMGKKMPKYQVDANKYFI